MSVYLNAFKRQSDVTNNLGKATLSKVILEIPEDQKHDNKLILQEILKIGKSEFDRHQDKALTCAVGVIGTHLLLGSWWIDMIPSVLLIVNLAYMDGYADVQKVARNAYVEEILSTRDQEESRVQ